MFSPCLVQFDMTIILINGAEYFLALSPRGVNETHFLSEINYGVVVQLFARGRMRLLLTNLATLVYRRMCVMYR